MSETPRSSIDEPDQHMEKVISTPSFDETNHQSCRGTPTSNSTNPQGWPLEETQEWDHRAERKPEAFNGIDSEDRYEIENSISKDVDHGMRKTPMPITMNVEEDECQTKTPMKNDVLPRHPFNDIIASNVDDLLMKLFPNKLAMPSCQHKQRSMKTQHPICMSGFLTT